MTTFPNHCWRLWSFNAAASRTVPGSARIYWYISLPSSWFLSLGLVPDYDERLVWNCGSLRLTRPETNKEREEREEGEAEWASIEHELHRYTEWYY